MRLRWPTNEYAQRRRRQEKETAVRLLGHQVKGNCSYVALERLLAIDNLCCCQVPTFRASDFLRFILYAILSDSDTVTLTVPCKLRLWAVAVVVAGDAAQETKGPGPGRSISEFLIDPRFLEESTAQCSRKIARKTPTERTDDLSHNEWPLHSNSRTCPLSWSLSSGSAPADLRTCPGGRGGRI